MINQDIFKLYVICNSSQYEELRFALVGGATCVQLREKNLCDDDYIKVAKHFKELCDKFGVPLVINDNPYVALKSGASGVHLGQDDMEIKAAKKIIGAKIFIGATAKTITQAKKAEQLGAAYLGSGAIFSSSTKPNAINISVKELNNICNNVSIPVCAIGGITLKNIKMINANIAGVAIASGILNSSDIEKTTRVMLKNINGILEGRENDC
ncbi:MAG: thiamine phosphate synthase [Bacilli bacterium]